MQDLRFQGLFRLSKVAVCTTFDQTGADSEARERSAAIIKAAADFSAAAPSTKLKIRIQRRSGVFEFQKLHASHLPHPWQRR